MPKLGLIGYPLEHSFSKNFFEEKFSELGLEDYTYQLFPMEDLTHFLFLIEAEPDLIGLNITIPYKEQIVQYMHALKEDAIEAGAVNTVKILRIKGKSELVGYNSDVHGLTIGLKNFITEDFNGNALILGSGGASKAAEVVLKRKNIPYLVVSRYPGENTIMYEKLTEEHFPNPSLIINATPSGMHPNSSTYPPLPYKFLHENCYLFDMVYNPEETLFMQKGKEAGAKVKNGLEMLHAQAEKAWEVWNS